MGTQLKGSTSKYLVQDGCIDVNRVRWTWTVTSRESLQLYSESIPRNLIKILQ